MGKKPKMAGSEKVWHQLQLKDGVLYRIKPSVRKQTESELLVLPNSLVAGLLE